MTIQYHCTFCHQVVRVPDGAEGNVTQCPSCGGPVSYESPVSINPYSSPASERIDEASVSPGYLVPSQLFLGETLRVAWQIATQNFVQVLLCGLILAGIQIGLSIVFAVLGGLVNVASVSVAGPNGIPGPNATPDAMPPAILIFQLVSWVLQQAIAAFVGLVAIKFSLSLVRGRPEPIADAFRIRSELGRCILIHFLMILALMSTGGFLVALPAGLGYFLSDQVENTAVVCGIVGFVIFLPLMFYIIARTYVAMYLIVDQGYTMSQSIPASAIYLRGNVLTAFALWLITSIGGMFFSIITCCLGSILVWPFVSVVSAVAYFAMTGQHRSLVTDGIVRQ